MYGSDISSSECRKTGNFNLPIKRKRDKSWKIESGKIVFTCFTSDFLLKDADPWRPDCWQMMKRRSDLWFFFFTKRIDRVMECVPDDWGDGQAHKANIDYKIGKYLVPETVKYEWKDCDYHD